MYQEAGESRNYADDVDKPHGTHESDHSGCHVVAMVEPVHSARCTESSRRPVHRAPHEGLRR
jgi:hypothetical protein